MNKTIVRFRSKDCWSAQESLREIHMEYYPRSVIDWDVPYKTVVHLLHRDICFDFSVKVDTLCKIFTRRDEEKDKL